jgi:hypothetical protein
MVAAAAFSAVAQMPARAQTGAVIFGLSVISYGWLSGASVARLVEGPRPARAGDSLSIRLSTPQRGQFAARIVSITQDSIALRTGDSTATFRRDELDHVRLYAGIESKWAAGWAIGFTTGALLGGAMGNASGGSPPGCEFICLNRDQSTLLGGILGSITGSVLGAGIGGLATGPHWRSVNRFVPSTDNPRLGIAPLIGPRTLGARIQIAVR